MGGSKKGEQRGNARPGRYGTARKGSSHETPNDVMKDAMVPRKGKGKGDRGPGLKQIDQRIRVARIIHGESGRVIDMTPKEVMLECMHDDMQAVRDWKAALLQFAGMPDSEQTRQLIAHAETQIERLQDRAHNKARDVAPFVHPKLAAIATARDVGDNPITILHDLMDEIDRRQREEPIPIEHEPKARTA